MRKFTRPSNALSQQLLNTIPKKMFFMLKKENLHRRENKVDPVTWNFREKRITVKTVDGQYETIVWTGSAQEPRDARLVQSLHSEWVQNIDKHLDQFVDLEKTIYTAVEHFIEEHRDERDIPSLSTTAS
jgi:hypothetical protein